MRLWHRFVAWRKRRRTKRAFARAIKAESRLVGELRGVIAERDREIRKLESESARMIREHDSEIRNMQTMSMTEREGLEHRIDRLERSLELAAMENKLLSAIHERDVVRLVAEASIHEKIAMNQQVQQPASF
jgi:predicted RNase H-like nuclease (RuvC/YqgF family)